MDEVVWPSSLRVATTAALRMYGVSLLSEKERFISCVSGYMDPNSPHYDLFMRHVDEELLQPLVVAASNPFPLALLAASSQIAEILTLERHVSPELSLTFSEELEGGLADYFGVDTGSARCMRCGKRLPYDARFCPFCGSVVSSTSVVVEPPPVLPPVQILPPSPFTILPPPPPPPPPKTKDFLLPKRKLEELLGALGFGKKEERPPDPGDFACCYAPTMRVDPPFGVEPSGSDISSGDAARDDESSRSRTPSYRQEHNPFNHGNGETS